MAKKIKFSKLMVCLFLGFTSLCKAEPLLSKTISPETFRLLNKFSTAFHLIRSQSYRGISDEELIQGAIEGMLKKVDEHSSYLNTSDYDQTQQDLGGEYLGIGIEFDKGEDGFIVFRVYKGSPAEKAGIRANDIIKAINGQDVSHLSTVEFQKILSKEEEKVFNIKIKRQNKKTPLQISMEKTTVHDSNIESKLFEKIGYIKIFSFSNEQTFMDFKIALEDLISKTNHNLEGLIIDLRDNVGGMLSQALLIANLFVEEGKPLLEFEARNVELSETYIADDTPPIGTFPLIILINKSTASSAEALALVLKELNRAIIIGQVSHGKGSVQTLFPLSEDGTAIRVTTGQYKSPTGVTIHKKGVHPSIVVQEGKRKDKTFQQALGLIKKMSLIQHNLSETRDENS